MHDYYIYVTKIDAGRRKWKTTGSSASIVPPLAAHYKFLSHTVVSICPVSWSVAEQTENCS